MGLRLPEMEFDTVYCSRTTDQAGETLLLVLITDEDCNPVDDALQLALVNSPLRDEGKGCVKTDDVSDYCDDTSANDAYPVIPSVCPT